MKKALLCTLVAALAIAFLCLDSGRWATPLPLRPHDTEIHSREPFANEPQSLLHFSGESDAMRLENGKIILNETSRSNGTEAFSGGFLTINATDITSLHYEYSVTVGNDTYVFFAGTEGDPSQNDTTAIINKNMGTMTAHRQLIEQADVSASDYADSLTLIVTTTHLDGSTQTHTLPLSVSIECQ